MAHATDTGELGARISALGSHLLALSTRAGVTIAIAESLTGGLACDALVGCAGASLVLRGGVVAYATDVKAAVLGVDRELLARTGPVDPVVAQQMARGVATALEADIGLATTGVAGPGEQDGKPPGTVFIAAAGPGGVACVRELTLGGDRNAIRRQTVMALLEFATEVVGDVRPEL